ncbi:MAG TPA: pitrilysin family protein [Mucilaginibacter sp.]|nr:pitrilysin family protein [Mucilaginibacter sp.]
MKKLVFTIIAVGLGFLLANAQSETQSFDVDGIKVIFKPTSKNVINIRLYFRGGVTNYMANKAGIENLALQSVVRCGSEKYSVKAVKDTTDNYDILLSGAAALDYGYVQLNCISKYFNQGWAVFSDAIMTPAFEPHETDLLKKEIIEFHKEYLANPENRLFELQRQDAFRNTAYAINPTGTEETLSDLTAADIANYYKSILNKNRIFIVVVGNVTKQDLYEKIISALDNIPSRPYSPVEIQAPVLKGNTLIKENGNFSTNYFGAVMNAPEYTSIYYVPFRMGITGIGGNLYQYLRSNRSLSYSPGSGVYNLRVPYAEMDAGTTNPKEAISGMLKVLKEVQTDGLNEEWLQHIKNSYLTQSYINDQSASAITNSLGLAEVLGGWQYAEDLPKLVQMVTVEQVNSALNTYIAGLKWTYVGNTDEIEGYKPPAY